MLDKTAIRRTKLCIHVEILMLWWVLYLVILGAIPFKVMGRFRTTVHVT